MLYLHHSNNSLLSAIDMKSFLIRMLVVLGFFVIVVPCQAQYAFNSVPANRTTVTADAEEKPALPSYKLIHGVIQGQSGALPGATVMLKGSSTIVVTNSEGEFEMRVPANAKAVTLVCGFGGLQEEVVSMAPVQAMGSIYLLRTKAAF